MAFPSVTVEVAFTALNPDSTTVSTVSGDTITETITETIGGTTAVTASSSTLLILDDATTGKLNTGVLGGDVWTDVTAYVHGPGGFGTKRGANRAEGPILRYEAGTLTVVLDNSERRFDPTNTAGPYTTSGVTNVTPMRPVRIRATWAGITYDVFKGYADDWDVNWQGPGMSTCTLTATDATKVLANYDRVALETPTGAGEDSGARVRRVLDSIAWPDVERTISTGNSTLQATSMDRSVWEELLLVQDSEIGEVYVDAAGRIVFRNRMAVLTETRSTLSQATFGNGVGELPYGPDPAISYDDTTMVNRATIARAGGTQQTRNDAASETKHLTHTHNRTDLLVETDNDAASYAGFIVYQGKDPELRFTSITLNGWDDENALYPQMLGRQFGDRITVVKRPPGGGTITRECFIRGVSHTVTDRWVTTFTLQSASRFAFFKVSDPVYGVLDSYALAH